MNTLFEIMPLLAPILLVDIILAVAAVRHILRHPRYRFGNKTMWLVIAVVLLLFGPIIYLSLERGRTNERPHNTKFIKKFWKTDNH